MAHIAGEIVINRPVNEVFDFVADERNEPRYNPGMLSAELTSAEPIGRGTRFRAESKMMGLTVETAIEFTAYERPRLLASTSRSVLRLIKPLPTADIQGTVTFDAVPEGTRMRWSWEAETRGVFKLMTPMVARMGRQREQTVGAHLKRLLEAEASPQT